MFPFIRIRISCVPFKKYIRITFFRKNSVAHVKNNVLGFRNFAVTVHPFKQDPVLFFRSHSVDRHNGQMDNETNGRVALFACLFLNGV